MNSVLMKLYYCFKSMSGVLNNARAKNKGWLCMCEQNSQKNLIYIRGMHQVNYKRMQIRPLAILSFSSLSLLLSLSHHPSSAPSTWKEQCGIWGDILCSLSLLLCLIKPQLSFYPMLHNEIYCRSVEIVDMCCGLLASAFEGLILGGESYISVLYKIKGLLATTFVEANCKNVEAC